MSRQPINTVEDAIRCLRCSDVEVISTEGGWILRSMDAESAYQELICDSMDELIACACREQQRQSGYSSLDQGLRQTEWPAGFSPSSAGNTFQATLTGWTCVPADEHHKEVRA